MLDIEFLRVQQLITMMELIHMTAAYSNAVLVAILPHVSDFSKKLNLPLPQPITVAAVKEFRPSPYKDDIGGGLMLTNGFWFAFNQGAVDLYRSPDDFFSGLDPNWPVSGYGKDNMTTNDALALARTSLIKILQRSLEEISDADGDRRDACPTRSAAYSTDTDSRDKPTPALPRPPNRTAMEFRHPPVRA